MNRSPLKAAGRTRSTPAIGIATNGFTAPNCCPELSRSSVAAEPAKDGWVVTDTVDERPSVAQSRSAGTEALNPPGELRVERFGSTFGIGDKVMQVENDYDKEVYNGDLGVVRSIDPETSEMGRSSDVPLR